MKTNCLIEACLNYFGFFENSQERTAIYEKFEKIESKEIQKVLLENNNAEQFLVKKINENNRKKYYYQYIYGRLEECCILIERGEYDRVGKLYSIMIKIMIEEVGGAN